MRIALSVVVIVGTLAVLFTVGTMLMNNMLLSFVGPDAPQPGVLAWATMWTSIFIIRNLGLEVTLDRVKTWVTGKNPLSSEIDEIRALREKLKQSIQGMYDEDNNDRGSASER